MKTKYQYIILILIAIIISIFLYNYIEENEEVTVETNILDEQKEIDKNLKEDNNYTFDNPKIILNPYKIAPLSALIIFKTTDLTPVTITIKGKDDDKDITNTFPPSKEHYIPIYGLYADYNNKIIIHGSNDTKTISIKTDKLPNDLKNADKSNNVDKEYFFTTSDGKPTLYDKNGNIRWYLTKNYKWDFTRLHNGYILLGNDDLLKMPNYSDSLLEMNLLGKIYYQYLIPGGYHHDVYEMENNNFLVLTNNPDKKTINDTIVEIDRQTGKVIKKIYLADLIKHNGKNWIDLNSIQFDEKTNSIIVCGSKTNKIININYDTEQINWIIGENEDSLKNENNATLPNSPTSLTLTENGIAFINKKTNQFIKYSIDNTNRTFKEEEKIDLNNSSKHYNLDYNNNDYILTSDNKIKLIDDKAFDIINTNQNLYSVKKSSMYAEDTYMLTLNEGIKLGSLGETKKEKNKLIKVYKYGDKITKKYNLKLKQNSNRLVVKGTFNKNDKVQIILDNVLTKETYNVDIKSGKKLKNNKIYTETYINKEGIYGKHYIFIKINGINYKLNKYITS